MWDDYGLQSGRHGGEVRLPSDSLSSAEWQAKNGQVNCYRLSDALSWQQFCAMPEDLQREYLLRLVRRFRATNGMLARLFGVSAQTVLARRAALGVSAQKGRIPRACREGFEAFCQRGSRAGLRQLGGCVEFSGPCAQALEAAARAIGSGNVHIWLRWQAEEPPQAL